MDNLKVSVIKGKDRQSDLNSYETTGPIVQETLASAESYACTRVPELVLSYTENAQKQKRIIKPVSVQCNRNGDVFIIDAGAAVLYAIDRSSVANMFTLGKYMEPSDKVYDSKSIIHGNHVHFSNFLSDMTIQSDRNDLYVVDSGRNEVVIVRNCSTASAIKTTWINVWKKEGVKSVCFFQGNTVCLYQRRGEQAVDVFDIVLPPARKTSSLEIDAKVLRKVKVSECMRYVFSVSDTVIGLVSEQMKIIFVKPNKKSSVQNETNVKTALKPQYVEDGNVAYLPQRSEQINHLTISCAKKDTEIRFMYSNVTKTGIPTTSSCFAVWGSTYIIFWQMITVLTS